VSTSYVKWLKL